MKSKRVLSIPSNTLAALGSWHGQRLSWVFVLGVFGLLLVQVARSTLHPSSALAVLLGSAPNLLAGFSLPALVLRQRENIQRIELLLSASQWGCGAILISLTALLSWEFAQPYVRGMYFDWWDVGATLVGGAGWAVVCIAFPMRNAGVPNRAGNRF